MTDRSKGWNGSICMVASVESRSQTGGAQRCAR